MAAAIRPSARKLELEFVPITNFRIEVGTTLAAHNIDSVPGFDDRTQLGWQGASLDLRYRFLDRDTAPFGLTLAVETHGDRIDETTADRVRSVGTELTLAVERDLIPHMAVATLNLSYQPEWTHFVGAACRGTGGNARRCIRRDGAASAWIPARRRSAIFPEI